MSHRATFFISQAAAKQLDVDLMSPTGGGFSLDQLMELAGLSVAQAIHAHYPPSTHPRPLVVCGPGNNGGDGLVAARHLRHFGYSPSVLYPRPTDKPLYTNLQQQLRALDVPLNTSPDVLDHRLAACSLVLDALFGFSFRRPVRDPFDAVIKAVNAAGKPVVCIDVPSGWDVESGPDDGVCIRDPAVLVSLSAPKPCAAQFRGEAHYLGGRFVPASMWAALGVREVPTYPGAQQFVRLDQRQ
ncbi:hypothetical protein RI367_003844 [Sorochytrium milnesiophthora]